MGKVLLSISGSHPLGAEILGPLGLYSAPGFSSVSISSGPDWSSSRSSGSNGGGPCGSVCVLAYLHREPYLQSPFVAHAWQYLCLFLPLLSDLSRFGRQESKSFHWWSCVSQSCVDQLFDFIWFYMTLYGFLSILLKKKNEKNIWSFLVVFR